MKSRDKTDIEIKLEDLMNRAMEFEGLMYWDLANISKEVWNAGGLATDEQFKVIAEQEKILIAMEERSALAAQDNQASASAGSAALGAEEAACESPAPAPVKRVAINQKAQKSFEDLGIVISSQVHDLMQGNGTGSIQSFKQFVSFFCNCAKKFKAAIENDEVLPPESLHGVIDLYHLDFNAPASELYPKLCAELMGGIPHIGD